MYDFDSGTWSQLSDMLDGRYAHGCGAVRKSEQVTEAVVVGGYSPYNKLEILKEGIWRYESELSAIMMYNF